MAIANNQLLTKVNHGSNLRLTVETLACLFRLTDHKLEVALSEGWVRCEMQHGDVNEIRANY